MAWEIDFHNPEDLPNWQRTLSIIILVLIVAGFIHAGNVLEHKTSKIEEKGCMVTCNQNVIEQCRNNSVVPSFPPEKDSYG